jgi:hypothetical protein
MPKWRNRDVHGAGAFIMNIANVANVAIDGDDRRVGKILLLR